jgi:tetratricopeptide (TPR) repeat protein
MTAFLFSFFVPSLFLFAPCSAIIHYVCFCDHKKQVPTSFLTSITNMETPSSLHPTFAPPDRKYIQCDNEGCGSVSPQLRCSRCRTVYYCSKTCQINNWPEHRSICRDFNTIKTQSPGSGDSNIAPVDMTKRVDPAAEMSCGICLEDTIEKPHALSNCQHVFCYPCLQTYQTTCKRVNQPLRCPLCRADTEDVQIRHWEAAFSYLCKAERKPKSSVERKELLQIAISELENISKDDVHLYIQGLITKISILDMLDDHESVLTVIDEILLIDTANRQYAGSILKLLEEVRETPEDEDALLTQLSDFDATSAARMRPDDRIEVFLQRASTYEKMENWEKAQQSYKDIFLELDRLDIQGTATHQRSVIMGLSRCFYHLKDFDKAIGFGEGGIEMNRHFPQAHKYVALSYKAKGDLETAIKLMSQAVLYETPWDDENIYQAKVLLDELIKSADKASV